jgi:hypothetical protein
MRYSCSYTNACESSSTQRKTKPIARLTAFRWLSRKNSTETLR